MTNITHKHVITTVDGRLCVRYYLLLQRLSYKKRLKDDSYKEYVSYHIKFPRVLYDLLDCEDNTVYLEKVDDHLVLHTSSGEDYKKVRIQHSQKKDDIGYQLTIPQKLMKINDYKRGETYILCQTIASDNNKGYVITLELVKG